MRQGKPVSLRPPLHVAPALLVREQLGEERGVVKDDAVRDQSAALRPEVLLVFGPKAQLSIVGIGDRATRVVTWKISLAYLGIFCLFQTTIPRLRLIVPKEPPKGVFTSREIGFSTTIYHVLRNSSPL